MKPVTVTALREMKTAGQKITCLTAYDYSFANLLDRAGLDTIMVGDSLGMTMQGHSSTLPVTIEDMAYHCACVARGVSRALIIGDMPFASYQISPEQAFENAAMLMQSGAQVIKLEGGAPMVETVRFLVERGIPVCAHLGLTPQSVHQLGGYRVQGREEAAAAKLRNDAKALEAAGASMIVLEAIPAALAKQVSQELHMPTIGIGAGVDTDGQVLVLQDMLGLYPRPSPKFSRNFMQGAASIEAAVAAYVAAVRDKSFPGAEHSY
ncbi:MAG: 3-methyl-2-oxobutanoate hydroxymethyltransferase [Gammaproteobacteria bacterium]|nr:3-methyl-2-oxobutanoate hydroxymethyltransferase [Gammaproteobacteria bacterium]